MAYSQVQSLINTERYARDVDLASFFDHFEMRNRAMTELLKLDQRGGGDLPTEVSSSMITHDDDDAFRAPVCLRRRASRACRSTISGFVSFVCVLKECARNERERERERARRDDASSQEAACAWVKENVEEWTSWVFNSQEEVACGSVSKNHSIEFGFFVGVLESHVTCASRWNHRSFQIGLETSRSSKYRTKLRYRCFGLGGAGRCGLNEVLSVETNECEACSLGSVVEWEVDSSGRGWSRGESIPTPSCIQCGTGSYYDEITVSCLLCDSDSYQERTGQSECLACPEGTSRLERDTAGGYVPR